MILAGAEGRVEEVEERVVVEEMEGVGMILMGRKFGLGFWVVGGARAFSPGLEVVTLVSGCTWGLGCHCRLLWKHLTMQGNENFVFRLCVHLHGVDTNSVSLESPSLDQISTVTAISR